jgi:hypothetical protein
LANGVRTALTMTERLTPPRYRGARTVQQPAASQAAERDASQRT